MERIANEELQTPPSVPAPTDSGKERLLELLVLLFLIVPSMVLSFFALHQGSAPFALVAAATILRDLALVSLIAFFLWRNGEPMVQIGWTLKGAPREAVLGAVLFVPMMMLASIVEGFLRTAGLSGTPTSVAKMLVPSGRWEYALAILLVAVVAVAEETIFRGYLILRLERVLGSAGAAVLVSAMVFSVGHGYEGTAGVATVGVLGLALAGVYLWRRSLVAPMVMHFLQDFTGIVLLPMLGHKH